MTPLPLQLHQDVDCLYFSMMNIVMIKTTILNAIRMVVLVVASIQYDFLNTTLTKLGFSNAFLMCKNDMYLMRIIPLSLLKMAKSCALSVLSKLKKQENEYNFQ